MKSLLIVVIVTLSAPAIADSIKADINCDGVIDYSDIENHKNTVSVKVVLGGSGIVSQLEFGLGKDDRQEYLCGSKGFLSLEKPDMDAFRYGLGSAPEGHQNLNGCFDLQLSGGECDSIHIYWNHIKNKLYWWRL